MTGNVIDFPAADRPITVTKMAELHAQAFCDLEGRISDCVAMAMIAAQLITNEAGVNGEVVFAVCHAFQMLKKLDADYQAAYHGERDIDP
jgi:hypothetical protein